MQPVIFINIGWMKRYQGASIRDPFNTGNFGYFKKAENQGDPGGEEWNFHAKHGWILGYVPRSAGIDITRLGASKNALEIAGVLVVFIARDPAVNALKVVGWYENATVNRRAIFRRKVGGRELEGPIKALAGDCRLLPVELRRSPIIPTAQKVEGGIGQSPVWYRDEHPDIIKQVRALVASGGRLDPIASKRRAVAKGGPRNLDPEARRAVEVAAIDIALQYFDEAVSVESEKKGMGYRSESGWRSYSDRSERSFWK